MNGHIPSVGDLVASTRPAGTWRQGRAVDGVLKVTAIGIKRVLVLDTDGDEWALLPRELSPYLPTVRVELLRKDAEALALAGVGTPGALEIGGIRRIGEACRAELEED